MRGALLTFLVALIGHMPSSVRRGRITLAYSLRVQSIMTTQAVVIAALSCGGRHVRLLVHISVDQEAEQGECSRNCPLSFLLFNLGNPRSGNGAIHI